MSDTFQKIATVTVGSGGASTMAFSSIPQTYTDLCIKWSARTDFAANYRYESISFNGNTSNYSWKTIYGNGVGTSSSSGTTERVSGYNPGSNATSSTFSNNELYIPNYTGSNNKSYSVDSVSENNATDAWAVFIAGLWSNTAAITSITLTPQYATLGYVQYTTATLYGILKA